MTTPTTRTTFVPAAAGGGDDPIFALNAEARRRAAAGESVVNATVGALLEDDGRLAVLPSVVAAMDAVAPAAAAGYAPIAGDPIFTDGVIADLFGGTDFASSATAVATPGGSGALTLAMATLLEPGQTALVPEHYWGPYETMARHGGRSLRTHCMFDEDGKFDVDAFDAGLGASIAAQGRALAILNFPCNNPTGYSLDAEEWRAVAAAAAEHARGAPVTVLIDHAYARFGAGDPTAWLAHVGPIAGDALVCAAWSASKSFLQYGARVGALVAVHPDPQVRARLRDAWSFGCRGTWSNCNHRGLLAVGQILTDAAVRARVDEERLGATRLLMERVEAFVDAAQGGPLRFPRYEGGFFVTVFTPDAREAAARMREAGVFVVPIEGGLRVALCSTPRDQVPRLVDALVAATAPRGD